MDEGSGCLFCAVVAGEVPSRQVHADEHAVAFLDIAPFHRGHTLVVPRRHVADLLADPAVLAEIAPAVQHTASLLVQRLHADGLNLLSSAGAAAGQEVFHLHLHLVPRYERAPGLAHLAERDADPDELDQVWRELGGAPR